MGRKLMRVPLDFNWPLDKVWKGYLNPFYKKCPDCENGYTKAAEVLRYSLAKLMWLREVKTSSELRELTSGLAGRQPSIIGHDSCDLWSATKKVIQAAGLDPTVWGICTTCKGEAIDPSLLEKYNSWGPTEPPKGEGYQLWETTTEGSPQSPVFKSLEELATWCEKNATTFSSFRAKKEVWIKMLNDDLVIHQEGNIAFI